jgi:hypothetical protein
MSVTLCEHRDFEGIRQPFDAGDYRADRGQFGALPNDSVSSARVPFGWTVDLFEHERDGAGGGRKLQLEYGNHPWVGADFNDKTSLVRVYPWTDVYLNSNQSGVPGAFTFDVGVVNGNVNVRVGFDVDRRYYKRLEYLLPPGAQPTVWEATRAGNAGWDHSIVDGVLKVNVWVTPHAPGAGGNWCGVRIRM